MMPAVPDDRRPGDRWLSDLARRLTTVPGIVGVTLGGSRARGTHTPESDTDLGLYYRPPLDVERLGELARDVAGPGARVTAPGEWGPWVDGGAWPTVDGAAVDWIYRHVDRVHGSWDAAQAGRVRFHAQVGHPLGVPDFASAGPASAGSAGRVGRRPTGPPRGRERRRSDAPDRT